MSNLIVHRSISDLYRVLGLPISQEMDFTIHFLPDIHPQIPFKSPVFRAEYYSFVFIKDGSGNYTNDRQTFATQPRTIYFTNPGHIKAFEINSLKDAYIITLTETFLKEYVNRDIFEEFPFLLAETVPPKTLAPEEYEAYETLYLQLYKEFTSNSDYKYKILGNLFMVLLLKIKERFWKSYDPIHEGNRSSQIVKVFREQLEKHYRDLAGDKEERMLQVQDYAAAQNLHPNYFSTVIKSKTGKTVQQWIRQKTLSTAKSLLKNTLLSVKQIGFKVGFSEPTHFNSYFKKHAGITPNGYRKKSIKK